MSKNTPVGKLAFGSYWARSGGDGCSRRIDKRNRCCILRVYR